MKTFKVVVLTPMNAGVFVNETYIGTFALDDIVVSGTRDSLFDHGFADDPDFMAFSFSGHFSFRFEGKTTFYGIGKVKIYDCRKLTAEQANRVFMDVVAGRI